MTPQALCLGTLAKIELLSKYWLLGHPTKQAGAEGWSPSCWQAFSKAGVGANQVSLYE